MEIVPPTITINEFKVESLNFSKKFMVLSFAFSSQLKGLVNKVKLTKQFSFNENIVNFVLNSLSEMKRLAGTETAAIEKEEAMKEKLVNTMTRLMTEIAGLERITDHEKYMKAFNRLNCFKVSFPEFEL